MKPSISRHDIWHAVSNRAYILSLEIETKHKLFHHYEFAEYVAYLHIRTELNAAQRFRTSPWTEQSPSQLM